MTPALDIHAGKAAEVERSVEPSRTQPVLVFGDLDEERGVDGNV
jgi:hypothetical protein